MEQITVRVEADTLAEIEAEAEEAAQSRSDYIRDVLGSRNESAADVERMREEIAALEGEIKELEAELVEERSRADRLAGRLDQVEATIQAKEEHIDSLESTVYEQQQAVNAAASGSVFGRIRSALGSGSDKDSE